MCSKLWFKKPLTEPNLTLKDKIQVTKRLELRSPTLLLHSLIKVIFCHLSEVSWTEDKITGLTPPPQLPVVEAAGDEGGEEGRHANEDSDDEDADLHPGHPVVRPANQKPGQGHVRPDQERVKYLRNI